MKVLKFGGTSVANAERLQLIKDIVVNSSSKEGGSYVIVSAFSGVTDLLVAMTNLANANSDYKPLFRDFKKKVNTIAENLLSAGLFRSIKSDLEENHSVLDNLLSGVQLIQEASDRTRDYILSFGERNCAFVFAHYLMDSGYNAEYIDARKYIKTDDSFGSARVNFEETNKVIQEKILSNDKIPKFYR